MAAGQCDDETSRLREMDREKGIGGSPLQGTQIEDRLRAALIQPGRRRYRRLRGFLEQKLQEPSRVEPRITSEFVPYRMEMR